MKHLIKRLLSGFLSVVLLSASAVTVFAEETQDLTFSPAQQPVRQQLEGNVSNEGPLPPDVIRVVLPSDEQLTSGRRTPNTMSSIFDIVLDPQGLIKASNAAKYDGATFGEGKLFFRNTAADDTVSYSMNSDPLTIINKSTVPVNLKLSLEVNKGSANFVFSDNTEFKDENGNLISGPALYLALANGNRRVPVTSAIPEGGTVLKHTATMESWIDRTEGAYDVIWDADANAYAYQMKEGLADGDFHSESFYMTGGINDNPWTGIGTSDKGIAMNVLWSVEFEAGPDTNPIEEEDAKPAILVVTPAKEWDDEVILAVSYGAGNFLTSKVTKMTYKNAAGNTLTVNAGSGATALTKNEDGTFTIKANKNIYEGSEWTLTFTGTIGKTAVTVPVPFNLKSADPIEDAPPTIRVDSQAEAVNEDAVLTVLDWGAGTQAMTKINKVVYTNASGNSANLGGTAISTDGDTVTIKALAAAFNGSDWKLQFANDYGDTYEIPFDLKDLSEDPTATVTTPATEVNGQATIAVTWGTGTKAMATISQVTYKNSDGEEKSLAKGTNLTVSGTTVTLTATSGIYNGSDWVLQFTNADGGTFDIPITPVEKAEEEDDGVDRDPYITVTKAMTSATDTCEVTIYMGSGSKKMTIINSFLYLRSDTNVSVTVNPATTSGAKILAIDGNKVTITGSAKIYQAKTWKFQLMNDSGQKKTFAFDPRVVTAQ